MQKKVFLFDENLMRKHAEMARKQTKVNMVID